MTKETEVRKHHKKFPPSSLPAMDQCPSFEPSEASGEAVVRGNILHDQFAELLQEREERRWAK